MKRLIIIVAIVVTLAFSQNLRIGDSRLSPRLLNYQGYLSTECQVAGYDPAFVARHEYQGMRQLLDRTKS